MNAVVDLSSGQVNVAAAMTSTTFQLMPGTWTARTEGNSVLLTEGSTKGGSYDKAPGFVATGHPTLFTTSSGTVTCLNTNGTPQRVYFAQVSR